MKTKTNLRRPLINLLESILTTFDEEKPVIARALKALQMRPVWRRNRWRLVARKGIRTPVSTP
jgi:hypothetical protein